MSEAPRPPFVPLPMAGDAPASAPGPTPPTGSGPLRVAYVRYRDPTPLEFPDRPERMAGPIFHAAGVVLREDDEFLALGEVALAAENPDLARRYGADLFPAYRNVLTVPKAAIVERRDLEVGSLSPNGPEKEPSPFGQT